MLRTLFITGLLALAGLVALRLAFGLLGPVVTLLFWLLGFALRVFVVGAVVYFGLRVISPATARRLRELFR